MLRNLLIQNIALIERLEVEFAPGLTVITGETGAGKSIIVDALSLALGERANTTLIRSGAPKAIVEAEFDAEGLEHCRPFVEEEAMAEWQPVLILRREVSEKGVSRCFINDTPVQVGILKMLGEMLVDLHGQHEHQSLLKPEHHLPMLDRYAGINALLEAYRKDFAAFTSAIKELEAAKESARSAAQRKELLTIELKQIDDVDPIEGEDIEIESKLQRAEHAERLAALCSEALYLLSDGDDNLLSGFGRVQRAVTDLASVDASMEYLVKEADSASASFDEIVRVLRDYSESLDFNPQETEAMKKRAMELSSLKKKLHRTLPEIIARRHEVAEELASLESLDDTLVKLERDVAEAREHTSGNAQKLTEARKKAAAKLNKEVAGQLAELGMKKTVFETRISQTPVAESSGEKHLMSGKAKVAADEDGWDTVEFFLSANVGEDPKPLAKVASGGEVSRIMLALKSILSESDRIPVLIFDEIDVGVSGGTASKVGMVMRNLAKTHQIFAITHLPQIAGMGDNHYLVEKTSTKQRTTTSLVHLDRERRLTEIARLLSGDSVTDTALKNAEELLAHTTG
ncbi:MAG: DNA repair protein RecN [Ectothiorhodospiraceae bacterium]|nr:DNA repair protein RecN [Ectothiorhodospiraceae bacterium]